MSTDLQHKMYNYEVNPPASSWDKIVTALDESHLTDQFPSILQNATATPPAGAWDTIAATLGELHLTEQFPVTLYNMSTVPPASAWGKIQASLEEKDEPVISINRGRRIPPFVRYAVAAILIGAIAFAAITFFNNKQETGGLAIDKTKTPAQDSNNNPVVTNNNTTNSGSAQAEEEARNDAALEESKHTYASVDISAKLRTNGINEAIFASPVTTIKSPQDIAPENTYRDLECSEVHNALYTGGNSAIDMAGRYAMLMTPDGHIIRISKKLGNLVCCVSGEEQDEDCKDQLKKWRQKMADSPVAPSPGNFMDILSLLHTLKDSNL
jgi:hypothetical protein